MTPTPTLVLQGDGGDLVIEKVNDGGWHRCYLEAEPRLFLGADILEHIASRLTGALGEDNELAPATDYLDGYAVRCALVLGETHHALYVATDGLARVLFWQNARLPALPIVAVIRLSAEQRHCWLSQIKEVCPGIWPSFQGSGYLDQKPGA